MTSIPGDSPPSSPYRGVIALHTSSEQDWHPILHSSNQVVLYNPKSHALSISHNAGHRSVHNNACPFCKRVLPEGFEHDTSQRNAFDEGDPTYHTRKPDYFQLLSNANESSLGPPPLTAHENNEQAETQADGATRAFPPNTLAEGYFDRFFKEEYKLGMGANGSVYLCQHMLDGNPLGLYAVKKIAVGESHSYLLNILREVRLLERLQHPNIIMYQFKTSHAWLETCQFSSFGPRVPTLHVLMQWAEGGSLDDFIDIRLGRGSPHVHINPFGAFLSSPNTVSSTVPPKNTPSRTASNEWMSLNSDVHSRSTRIRAFRAYQRAPPEEQERMRRETLFTNGKVAAGRKAQSLKAVHLLSADEVQHLFRDVVEGLNFLHGRSMLHLDLKPGNVLLTWDEGQLIPRAMLADFGTSRDMVAFKPVRSGNTGTLEYASPESLPSPQTGVLYEVNSKSDMWSLGMILHKLLFFKLPYRYAAEGDREHDSTGTPSTERQSRLGEAEKLRRLEEEVLTYPGFKASADVIIAFETRRIPRNFLRLLEGLLNRVPSTRPSCERVSAAIREGKLDPLKEAPIRTGSSLVPLARSTFGLDLVTESKSDLDASREVQEQEELAVSDIGGAISDSHSFKKPTFLGLPSPSDSPESMDSQREPNASPPTNMKRLLSIFARHRELIVRVVKSSVLVAKVLSLPRVCSILYGFPRLWVTSMLTGVALVDAVVEMPFFLHAGLSIFHMLVIKIGCAYANCSSQ